MKARAVVVEAIEFAELFVFSSELTVISSAESFTQNFVFSWGERVGEKEMCKEKKQTWTTVANIFTFLPDASDGAVHLGFYQFLTLDAW